MKIPVFAGVDENDALILELCVEVAEVVAGGGERNVLLAERDRRRVEILRQVEVPKPDKGRRLLQRCGVVVNEANPAGRHVRGEVVDIGELWSERIARRALATASKDINEPQAGVGLHVDRCTWR